MLEQTPREQRQQLIDTNHSELSLRQQCELLKINRSTLYYKVGAADTGDINLLNEMREIWEKYPFYGYRRITKELVFKGYEVNRKRVQRLMQLGGIQAIYAGPNTSKRNKLHAVHPYLLRGVNIVRPNQVWMIDITYLRLNGGFNAILNFSWLKQKFKLKHWIADFFVNASTNCMGKNLSRNVIG